MVYRIKRDELNIFLEGFARKNQLVAPLKGKLAKFELVKEEQVKDIYLEKNTYFPAKEFFFKKNETVFTFKDNKIQEPKLETPKRIFFGLRRCDLNAVKHQDKVFMEQIKDPYYMAARENSYLLGFHCWEAPSKYCFCGTLNLADYYDLMFYDKKDYFLVEVGSDKGKELIKEFKTLFEDIDITITKEEKKIKGADRLLKDDIKGLYDHPDWQKGVNQCLSCAACTNLCPTCYCFELHDETKTSNIQEGKRVRNWSSCQVLDFSRVAGEHVFRQKREERFKHRIYHQLEYFKERYGVNMCVGCGRCIQGCPTRIDFVQIINEMK
jgi:ferredoxin